MELINPLASGQKVFHSKVHWIDLYADDNKIRVKVKEMNTNACFIGEFTIGFIENLTHKAGSSKKFNVFRNMLASAIQGISSAVVLGLESHTDLEKLRSKPLQGNANTIYLILTYLSEFDKVFYPLPLKQQAHSQDFDSLLCLYKDEISHLTGSLNSISTEKIQLLEECKNLKSNNSHLKSLLEKEKLDKEKIFNELESNKKLYESEVRTLQLTIEQLKQKTKNYTSKTPNGHINTIENLKQENIKLDFEKKVLNAEIKTLKIMNKKRKLKIQDLQKRIDEGGMIKERSKSVINKENDVCMRKSDMTNRCKSSIRAGYGPSDITEKLEKIVNLLGINEKHNLSLY
ncbi:hypothetical protein SteCoe_8730 [Stentor coeruleus]|uniref:Uncharacterized protein n=1 Tax=Stentor coeruleus TaxID=5963 RepID=A0A1R2CJP7_9CILI|nr:hypothetical protein SteCoe_8730 [Stentor coeruleus]